MTRHDPLRALERRIGRQVDARLAVRRVWESLPAIGQILLAVVASYSIAHWGLGHAVPVLAVTVTITSLGFTRDARPRRVAESVLGILLGIALADGLSLLFGKGLWQLVVVLLAVFVIGRAVATNPGFAVAAAVPSSLVLLLPDPEGGPFTRSLDGLVGGVIALLVTALIPRDPRGAATRDARVLFSVLVESLDSLTDAFRVGDRAAAELSLARLRRTQALVDAWSTSLDTAVAVARVSPFLRRHLPELQRQQRALVAADLAARHLRVIARRGEFLIADGVVRPWLADVTAELATGVRLLGEGLRDPELTGAALTSLEDLARRCAPDEGRPLSDAAVVLLMRPLLVDLLVGGGMPVERARGLLPPV